MAFTVHWTGYNIYITVNASLQDQTCGLCGTFNDMKEDDFHLRSGDDKVDMDEFAKEWLIPDLSQGKELCKTESVESSLDYCDIYSQKKTWSLSQCSILKGTKESSLTLETIVIVDLTNRSHIPHFNVFCDLLLNKRTATWNLFVLYNKLLNVFDDDISYMSVL